MINEIALKQDMSSHIDLCYDTTQDSRKKDVV